MTNERPTRVLFFHAGYRCRDSGVCCSSDWPIPVEPDGLATIQAGMSTGTLTPVTGRAAAAFRPTGSSSEVLLNTRNGRCVFHDPAGRCAIHRALGHAALPLACRQFPRSSVIDPRGVSVTLSHYCPTAAGMLASPRTDADDLLINAPGFPSNGEYVGLDARPALPPLLKAGMLMDWVSWWEIERLGVAELLRGAGDSDTVLSRVHGRVAALLRWNPMEGPLLDRVHKVFEEEHGGDRRGHSELVDDAIDAIPEPYRDQARWQEFVATPETEVRRFLAAHAFANWTVHLGGDLLTWVRSVETAQAFLQAGAGVRHTDLVLRHLVDLHAWTRSLTRRRTSEPRNL